MRFTPWVIYAVLCLLFQDLDVARQQVLVLLNDCDLRYQLLVVRRCCPVSELFPRHIVPEVDRKDAVFVRKNIVNTSCFFVLSKTCSCADRYNNRQGQVVGPIQKDLQLRGKREGRSWAWHTLASHTLPSPFLQIGPCWSVR